jgi:hypothetical protein
MAGIPTTTTALVGTLAAATAIAGGHEKGPQPNGECKLLGSFALIVQAALGGLALMSLVYKRWRERPQRPLKIWTFDVSKQVVGSILVHIANLLMSMLSSGQFSIKVGLGHVAGRVVDADGHYQPNPCSFYLLNLAIDVSIIVMFLQTPERMLTSLLDHNWYSNPYHSSPDLYRTLQNYSIWKTTRIY